MKKAKAQHSAKQKRQAKHIEDSEKKSGRSDKKSEEIAWATVNKQAGASKKTPRSPSTHTTH